MGIACAFCTIFAKIIVQKTNSEKYRLFFLQILENSDIIYA